jgi:hypothetical protein
MGQLERPKQIPFLDKATLDRKRAQNESRQQREQQPPKRKGGKPAHRLLNGLVETRIWENKGDNGRPDWKIEQVRFYCFGEQGEAKSFRHENLKHATHGLTQARLWIEKEERQRGLRRRSWWWPFS